MGMFNCSTDKTWEGKPQIGSFEFRKIWYGVSIAKTHMPRWLVFDIIMQR